MGFSARRPQPDGVALLRGEVAERAAEFLRVVDLRRAGRAEVHRAAGVEQAGRAAGSCRPRTP